MHIPILMLIIVCFPCGGALALAPKTGGSVVNVTQVKTPNITVILEEPFLNDNNGMYTLMSLSWNQEMSEALSNVNCVFNYVITVLKVGIALLEKNMEMLYNLHRRRQEALNLAFRTKQRRYKKTKPSPPLKLAPYFRPPLVRLLTESTLLSYLNANINTTTGQPYVVPKKVIIAIM